ncbi:MULTISPECIES: NAD-dependent epimerase/dehydratase family protein [unclassified Streptomyces]|uniref:NAD-dependent epimerase/dehydratase family protein n=1 Tax=unclassified Streptomyces TaxID=2593676 RepID=UPI001F032FE8|nr:MULTISPECIES: NAD-dependent epimerase/dehydratase family protein [unclassified Streptomyces]MCH0561768.1 NAD-dependent epimerase/dehydratase family protein [Streptomyces sp. MUM 2J]MCH0571622.1 NAD-dependent epimerase/dehydratase family protein [Streptomyces sp. MUM 136J]
MHQEPDLTGIPVDTSAPVLVTGATGYVAGWLVKGLLDAGVTVHAAVRDPGSTAKIEHLVDFAEKAPGDIRFFAADLLEEGSYAEAMAGCRIVFHTASPFTSQVDDPQRELIDPAVLGTRTVLESANATPSVQRVVLTSSCAAIYTDATDCAKAPGGRLTEDVWNTTASLDYQPYSYSKLLAERAAWDIADAQDRWRLVVINPSLVIGPSVNAQPTSESFSIVRQLGDGTLRRGAPRAGLGVVDVRDLARAHIAAGYLPDAHGRHILSGHDADLLALGRALLPRFGDRFPIPRRALPKPLVWLAAPSAGLSRTFVSRNVGVEWHADNGKSRRELGMVYRPLQESMEDMFQQFVEQGAVTARA